MQNHYLWNYIPLALQVLVVGLDLAHQQGVMVVGAFQQTCGREGVEMHTKSARSIRVAASTLTVMPRADSGWGCGATPGVSAALILWKYCWTRLSSVMIGCCCGSIPSIFMVAVREYEPWVPYGAEHRGRTE